MLKKIILLGILISITSGCTIRNSFPVEYKKNKIENITVLNLDSVGVTKWQDKRSLASFNDELAEKAVMRMGPAIIGITSDEVEFVRVADFVRDNFIKELTSLGVNAKALDVMPSNSDTNLLANIANNNNVKMIISADLLNFDINCSGTWTLECTRNVSFSMTMVDNSGNQLITRELFNSTFANNEGMAVLHPTLLEQIKNDVLREALKKAVIKTIEEVNKKA